MQLYWKCSEYFLKEPELLSKSMRSADVPHFFCEVIEQWLSVLDWPLLDTSGQGWDSLFLCVPLSPSLPPLSALSSSLPRLVPIESGITVWSGRISMRAGALPACARVCGTLVLKNTYDWRKLQICFWFFWGDLTAVSNVYAHCGSCYFCDNGRFLT